MRYMRFVLSALLIMMALLMTTGVFAQETIGVGDTVEGVRTTGDNDYTIELEEGQLVFITVVSEEFDSNLAVLVDAEQIAFDDDSGGSTNPFLAFLAPASGTYTIRVGAYSRSGAGAFTLTVKEGVVTPITVGTPVDVQFTGEPTFFTFDATAGDVVTIGAVSDNYISADLSLVGPDGVEVSNNSSLFISSRQLRRVSLPLTGLYSVKMSSYSVSEVAETVTLSVVPDTVLTLDDGSLTVIIDEETTTDFDVVRFTATAGTVYVLTATTDNPDIGVRIDIPLGFDEYGFTITGSLVFRYATAGTVEFTALVDGEIGFVVSEDGFFSSEEKPSSITLSIAPK